MARINIEDQFFISAGDIAAKVGGYHIALGMALKFWKFAQDRYKNDMIVSDDDFIREGFHEALVPQFAVKVDGGYRAVGDEKMFGWLRKRVEAGAEGGKKSGESRRKKSNDLTEAKRSKPKQTEASPSPSYSNELQNQNLKEGKEGDQAPPLFPPPSIHWLGELWNSRCGKLRKVSVTKSRDKAIATRLRENPHPFYWTGVVDKIAASDFCNGENDRGWEADFDWLVGVDKKRVPNHVKVMEDKYINKAKKGVKGTGSNEGLYEQLGAHFED